MKIMGIAGIALTALVPTTLGAQALQVNASIRVRTESWSWFGASPEGAYTFTGVLARLSAKQQRASFGWIAEMAMPVLVGLPDDAVASGAQGQLGLGASYWVANDSSRNSAGLFLKQAMIRVGVAPGKTGHALRAGRFEFVDGMESIPQDAKLAALKRERIAHRIIGNFGWSHAQRSFDGVHYSHDTRSMNVTAAAFRPTQGVFETNGWPELKVKVAYTSVGNRAGPDVRYDWRVFAVHYRDGRADPVPLKADNRTATARQADAQPVRITTLGAHYVQTLQIAALPVDLLAWGAVQAGDWGALQQSAYALALEAGVQPRMPLRPWLRVGYARASGDGSASDDKHATFFPTLPTPRAYARFPFYNAMNLDDRYASLALTPSGRVGLRFEAHRLALAESADGWYGGGGAFDARTFGFSVRPSNGVGRLATLIDASMQVHVSRQFTANAYVGRANGGAVIDRVYPAGSTATLGYVEVEWRR